MHKPRRIFRHWSKKLGIMLVLPALLSLSALQTVSAETPVVELLSTEIPGLVEDRGGVFRIFLEKAAEEAGTTVDLKLMPWVRAVSRADRSETQMILPFSRTAEREHNYQWAAKLQTIENGFVSMDRKIDRLHQAYDLKEIIVWRGSSQQAYLERQGFTNIFPVSTADTIFSLLQEGRAAAWFGVLEEAEVSFEEDTDHRLKFGDTIYAEDIWLAAGPNVDLERYRDFLDAVDRLREAGYLDQLRAEGSAN